MVIRNIAGAMLVLTALSAFAQQRTISVFALIEELRELGYTIIYSDSVVRTNLPVQVDTVDIEALEQVLTPQHLELQRHGTAWVISPGAAPGAATVPIEVILETKPVLETVIVTGTRHRFPGIGAAGSGHSFKSDEMALTPSMASDAMRVTLRLPGVSSVGVSAKPRIRGGLQDELLVIQDGVELLEPFHLADYHSAYSAIDYRTIESLDIYTGGFPSRYGNRMSGVIDISNNWEIGDYNTDIGVSSFATFVNTRGTFGDRLASDWSLSARKGDLSDLTDYIQAQSGSPKYQDIAARMNLGFSHTVNVMLGVVHAEDDIVFKDEEESASSQVKTNYVWGGFDWQPSEILRSRMTVSWLEFQREKRQNSFELDDVDEGKGGALDHRQRVKRLALRNDFSAIYQGQFVEFGWQAEYNDGDYRHVSAIDRGELAELIGTVEQELRNIRLNPKGWSGGAYLQAEWQVTDRLLVQPSVRWDYQNYYLQGGSDYQISPRLGLAFDVDEDTRLRLSLGRYHQPESIQELQVLDGITQFYSPQHSDQFVAGIEWSPGSFQFVGEIYYKNYGEQKGRFENMFNPFVLLPEMEPDRVGLEPDRGLAKGLDLSLEYEVTPALDASLRYSYMDAADKINSEWVQRRWSQQHTVNAGLVWQRDSYSVSLALAWHSGWRSSQLPHFIAEGTVVPLEDALNNVELDPYLSVDISVRKSWQIGRAKLQIYADIANVTDHRNAAGIDYDVEEVEGGFELVPDHENLLGRVPSIGITLSF